MNKIYDIIIIGAGPAGMTAAIYAVRANMKVLMLDKLSPGGQMINTSEVENYTGVGKISGAELAIKMFEHTQELGVEFEYKTVVDLSDDGVLKKIICKDDGEISSYISKAVIVATGTVPRRLGVPGEDIWAGNGISWCATCDGPQYEGKEVVVIGGGNSAVEESFYLARICTKLTIITRSDLAAEPKACSQLRNMKNVTIYPYQKIIEFTGKDRLDGVRFISTKEDKASHYIKCDGVFEYIGFKACSDPFCKLDILDSSGCIEVDTNMRTKIPGIFGAGDITVKHLRQIITACGDGALAAKSAVFYVESKKEYN